jgi:hypothetical protein
MSETTHQNQTTHTTQQSNTITPQATPATEVLMLLRQATTAALPLKPRGILQLQRLIGNQATRRFLIQRADKLQVDAHYKHEAQSSSSLLPKTIVGAFAQYMKLSDEHKEKAQPHWQSFKPFMEDVEWVKRLQETDLAALHWILQNLVKGLMKQSDDFVEQILDNTTKVEYLDENARKQYHAGGNGSNLVYDQRPNPEPVNTENMFSLQSGNGYGIFVMNGNDLYVGEHKGAQFHHSSFLAGGAADSAGEVKTNSSGTLLEVTNKSGHYKPSDAHLAAALENLQKIVSLDSAKVMPILSGAKTPIPAIDYLAQHQQQADSEQHRPDSEYD